METEPKKQNNFLAVSILLAAVIISGSIIYSTGNRSASPSSQNLPGDQAAALNKDALKIAGRDVILGDPKAPVTYIEYGDYQCPFCARLFTQVEGRLRDVYVETGKLKMVYRNFAFLGPESIAAAEAAECAKDQQKFWAYHDALYAAEALDGQEHNGNLNKDFFIKTAQELGLNVQTFTSCIDSKQYADLVAQETQNGQKFGVDSTPTVFVNDQLVRGAQPFENFASLIDEMLKK